MKRLLLFSFLFLVLFSFSSVAYAKKAKIEDIGDGWYQQIFKSQHGYVVDTKTKLCFARRSNGGFVDIDCTMLKKRKGWKDKITW